MTDEELNDIIGPMAMQYYTSGPEYAEEEVKSFARSIREADDNEFVDMTSRAILESARMGSFRGNFNHLHAMADGAAHEANRRHQAAGHDKECRGDNLYNVASARAYRSQGHTPRDPVPCSCKES
ncbi:hypothetical protein [Rhodococcus qingshengii]|uniref:hypothetical protein n=1 Tax=Rhodococcus qingshengii TaxID=334542 RepID=UPI0035DF7A84